MVVNQHPPHRTRYPCCQTRISNPMLTRVHKQLIKEFAQHLAEWRASPEFSRSHPNASDRQIFEGWIIQKVAGLQFAVEYLATQGGKVDPAIWQRLFFGPFEN